MAGSPAAHAASFSELLGMLTLDFACMLQRPSEKHPSYRCRAMTRRSSEQLLHGLSTLWEEEAKVRRASRETGHMVRWPSPKVVGIPSMSLSFTWTCDFKELESSRSCTHNLRKSLIINVDALKILAKCWVEKYDFKTVRKYKTPPLRAIWVQVAWFLDVHAVGCCQGMPIICEPRSKTSGARLVAMLQGSSQRTCNYMLSLGAFGS